mmetsp:Transcript_21537/g.46575  ORF Transcript_21537/g.46575 Transcript_21537/m.46575 type:complete len:746 (+) Transcript_21537:84-2321(+)
MRSSINNADVRGNDGKGAEEHVSSPLLNLPPAVSTGRVLPFVESCDLLSFRVGCTGCYHLVHGGGRGASGRRAAAAATATAASGPSGNANDDIQAAQVGDVHESNTGDDGETESENLWRQMLARDFGFCYDWDVRCGDEDGTLKGEMHLRTFRDPDEDNGGRNTRCWAGKACREGIADGTTVDKREGGDGSHNDDVISEKQQKQPPRKLMRCSRCQTARYCDRACQAAHHRQHKSDCKKWSSSDLPGWFVGGSFLNTSEEMVAESAFESWKTWERLRLRFDREARRIVVDLRRSSDSDSAHAYFPIAPKMDETFRIIGPFFLRCAETWRTIEKWCRNDRVSGTVGRHILKSLRPGRALPFTKTTLGYQPEEWAVQSPHHRGQPLGLESLMAVYAFYAGQDFGPPFPSYTGQEYGPRDADSLFAGLLGSYSAYDFFSSTRLYVPTCEDGKRCTVAVARERVTTVHGHGKTFTLDLTMGCMCTPEVHAGDDEGRYITSYRSAAPISSITPGLPRDSIIVWLNEYANRLENGMYSVGKIRPNDAGSAATAILLYPTLNGSATTVVSDAVGEPHTTATNRPSRRVSRCVTRGIEVVASAVHAHDSNRAIYSIRIRIVQPGEEGYLSPSDRGFHSCQLRSRRWTLTSNETGEEEHVSGEGVTGCYPLLLDNGGHHLYYGGGAALASLIEEREEETFVYQSMSNVYEGGGTMSGTLQFVPGNLRGPTGPEFDVVVASFPLPTFRDGDPFVY